MVLSRRRLLAATGASVAISGCLGGVGGGSDGGSDGGSGATVQVSDHAEYGEILVDAAGMTLYLFDADTQGSGESSCTGGCLDAWPPLTADGDPTAGDGVTTELTTFDRGDGTMQVAAGGWPLYFFSSDENPGDANGQGSNDVWWVVGPDGTKVTGDTGQSGPGY